MTTDTIAVADLCDTHGETVSVCAPGFRDFGARRRFGGAMACVQAIEDNSKVREVLESDGAGRVLVIDGGGWAGCALVGGNLGFLAAKNGWAGIVVNGYVRDSGELRRAEVGIKALGLCPRRSEKQGRGTVDVAVTFGGVTFQPGEYLYADPDGIIVSPKELDF